MKFVITALAYGWGLTLLASVALSLGIGYRAARFAVTSRRVATSIREDQP
jgi:hypothetical protein